MVHILQNTLYVRQCSVWVCAVRIMIQNKLSRRRVKTAPEPFLQNFTKKMGGIISVNMVEWMLCTSSKSRVPPALSREVIDFAALHQALGGTNQFAVKSIISLGEIKSARFSTSWLSHTNSKITLRLFPLEIQMKLNYKQFILFDFDMSVCFWVVLTQCVNWIQNTSDRDVYLNGS